MKFEDKNFYNDGQYLRYMHGGHSHFIARFKYRGPIGKSHLRRTLVKHYDVQEYLNRVKKEAPLEILMTDGYLVFDPELKKFSLEGKVI